MMVPTILTKKSIIARVLPAKGNKNRVCRHSVGTLSSKKGMTMVELMICVLILGILGMVAIPSFGTYLNERKLSGSALEIVSAIQYAQSLSIRDQKIYGVIFDQDEEQVICYENKGYTSGFPVMQKVNNPLTKTYYEWDFDDEGPFQGVDIALVNFGGNNWIEFNSQGTSVSANGSPIEDGTLVLKYAGAQQAITVAALTGIIRVN